MKFPGATRRCRETGIPTATGGLAATGVVPKTYSYVRNNPLSATDPDGHCGLLDDSCTWNEFFAELPDRLIGGLKGEANALVEMTVLSDHVGRFEPSSPEQAEAMQIVEDVKSEFQTGIAMALPGPKGARGGKGVKGGPKTVAERAEQTS